ncbi:MAG: D-alanyl-D-alanine carboxypeptidase family protein [Syntrophomonadaceae bacterium]|nr:D-alanyl-D-alanine carboxypeptidase family protein [Syntrophomonadaceae bacterium]
MLKHGRPIHIICLLFLITTYIVNFPGQADGSNFLQINAAGAVLMDAGSGQVLFTLNPDQTMPMASTTKIMTALLVLEQCRLDEMVTTSDTAAMMEGTRVYLEPGETKTVEELLFASLLNSANDAAWALAEYVGKGSVENFVALMNRRAQELGAINTQFVNPTGLHDPKHYSTPRDLGLITRQALKNPEFRRIVSTRTRPWMGNLYQNKLYNINRLLFSYQGATGVKTGYTRQARNCLVASAKRGDRELIAVILGSSGYDIWEDAARMLDYGFEHFCSQTLLTKNQFITRLELPGGRSVELLASRDLNVSVPINSEANHQSRVELNQSLKGRLPAGTIAGYITFIVEGEELEPVPLVTAAEVPPEPYFSLPLLIGGFAGLGGAIYWREHRRRRRVFSIKTRAAARRAARRHRRDA